LVQRGGRGGGLFLGGLDEAFGGGDALADARERARDGQHGLAAGAGGLVERQGAGAREAALGGAGGEAGRLGRDAVAGGEHLGHHGGGRGGQRDEPAAGPDR